MDLEVSIACWLDVDMAVEYKKGIYQVTHLPQAHLRIKNAKGKEASIDVTELLVRSIEAMDVVEDIGIDYFIERS